MGGREDDHWLAGQEDATTATKRIVRLQQGNLQTSVIKDEFITAEKESRPARESHFPEPLDH